MKIHWKYFTKTEWCLWLGSLAAIILSFVLFDRENYVTFAASLLGVTSLIFAAKGNPFGQALMIVFCFMYGFISLSCRYYGEMLTYVGMTGPMAVFSLIAWLRHPYKGNKAQVEVRAFEKKDIAALVLFTALVTFVFYFILKTLHTDNLIPSTVSVTTSFLAVYLTYKRSPLYAVAYAANDIVLIVLWLLATVKDTAYVSMIVCFLTFLANDIYGYINWRRLYREQNDNH